ncbi:hypothetical protein ACOMHN_035843 [Nucella lapillus]
MQLQDRAWAMAGMEEDTGDTPSPHPSHKPPSSARHVHSPPKHRYWIIEHIHLQRRADTADDDDDGGNSEDRLVGFFCENVSHEKLQDVVTTSQHKFAKSIYTIMDSTTTQRVYDTKIYITGRPPPSIVRRGHTSMSHITNIQSVNMVDLSSHNDAKQQKFQACQST